MVKRISDYLSASLPVDAASLFEVSTPTGGTPAYASYKVRADDATINRLSSGTVSVPVSGISISLPSGFRFFELRISNIRFSANDWLTAAFSFDGGTTYLYDNVNYDAYGTLQHETDVTLITGSGSVIDFGNFNALTDSLMWLSGISASSPALPASPWFGLDSLIQIIPGSTTELPRFHHQTQMSSTAASSKIQNVRGDSWPLGSRATIPLSPARATNILLQPYGNAAAPQGGTVNIVSGDYLLLGCK